MGINNQEALKEEIMHSQSHLFLYGKNGKERADFLKKIEASYPIVANQNNPMGIYINDTGLGSFDTNEIGPNEGMLLGFHSSYYDFLVADNLVKRIIDILKTLDDEKIISFLKEINSSYINRFNRIYIPTIEDLKKHLEETLAIFMYDYGQYIRTGDLASFSYSECLSICMIEDFIKEVKPLINNASYFNFIIDQQVPLSILCQMAINKYISRRSHDIMSISVACQGPKDWCFNSIDGYPIRFGHDFSQIELNESGMEDGDKLILEPKTSKE